MTTASFCKPRAVKAAISALLLAGALAMPAHAYPRPGITERMSVGPGGVEADGYSALTAITPDGRHVAFESYASNLASGDSNDAVDVFVRDRKAGIIERVSVTSGGQQGNSHSYEPVVSADARHVAFYSAASNLVAGDTNDAYDVFVHDRATGTTERLSVASDGSEANDFSVLPAISADGRHVAFWSNASNLVPGDTNGAIDVFVHDRAERTTERVSVTSDGSQAESDSFTPDISGDGRYVTFYSNASNLAPGAVEATPVHQVFVHDRATGSTELVSLASDGTRGNSDSYEPAITPDGRHVAFTSQASNLAPGDTNNAWDVFVHDRATGVTERVNVSSDGAEATLLSAFPSISADGRRVAFWSDAPNLVPGDTNGTWDVFVRDLDAGATERVSVASDGAQANGRSYTPAMSGDGRYVAIPSEATNLVPGDTNGVYDVFVHDRGGSVGIVGSPSVVTVPGGVEVSGRATFSATILATATDPGDDGTSSSAVGGELTGARLVYRPEQEDLLVRLDLVSLPPAAGGLPGVLYGAELRAGETRYEIRALRAAVSAGPRAPSVALYRCAPTCAEHAALEGSFGTTGTHVLASVPLAALGITEGTQITGVRAFTAAGETAPGALLPLDEVSLSSSVIPTSRVELGIAPASTPADQVAFTVEADRLAGNFSGTARTDELVPGSYRVWARACVGDTCGPAAFSQFAV